MDRKLFIKKNNNSVLFFILSIFLFFLISYFVSFYININKNYFKINSIPLNYFIIPEDKEGEKVNYLDKKSLNNFSVSDLSEINFAKNQDLKYTIQILSDSNYNNLNNFLINLVNLKSELILMKDFYILPISTNIGIDYFLTYKNFNSKKEANSYCKKLSFINRCLILNVENE